jgi:hypothetical protein
MSRFKVGDRVRDITPSDRSEGVVVDVNDFGYIRVKWDGERAEKIFLWPASDFELVEPAKPIETVDQCSKEGEREMNEIERAKDLLKAAYELLKKQDGSSGKLELGREITSFYGAEWDGHSLIKAIREALSDFELVEVEGAVFNDRRKNPFGNAAKSTEVWLVQDDCGCYEHATQEEALQHVEGAIEREHNIHNLKIYLATPYKLKVTFEFE